MEAIAHLDKAAAFFPLKTRFRIGPAVGRSVVADANGKPRALVEDAVISLRRALTVDYTRADLLVSLIQFEAAMGDLHAEIDYQLLRKLAPRSKVVIETEKMRRQ